jgi:hypothetical protein
VRGADIRLPAEGEYVEDISHANKHFFLFMWELAKLYLYERFLAVYRRTKPKLF